MGQVKTAGLVLVGAGVVAAVFGGIVLFSGIADVGARPPHAAVTTAVLHTAFTRSVAHHAGSLTVPDDLQSSGRIALGAQTYQAVCSNCHGSPGMGQNPIALSMRPSPQYLPAVVGQFTDAELAWIVDNGVRLSAMPAWPAEGRLDETWAIVAFLKQLPGMTAEQYRLLTAPADIVATAMPYGPVSAPVQTQMPRRSEPLDEYAWTVPAAGFGGIGPGDAPLVRCASCHGADGRGLVTGGEAPNLTIQTPEYIHAALRSYAEARRHSGFMQPQAATLSDAQMTALADHFTRAPRAAGAPANASPDMLARGRDIAMSGIPDRNVAACLDCHERGADDPQAGLYFPSLYGQSETFLSRQLALFASGNRGATGIYNPMHGEAHGMTDADRAAVSAWLAAQVPTRVATHVPAATDPVAMAQAKDITVNVCSSCHGADLQGSLTDHVPNLTLQTAPYLFETLHSFGHNQRHSGQMVQLARSLTNDEIAGLAGYIGGLPAVAKAQTPDADAVARGATLAALGDPARDLPACATCHAAATVQNLPLFARLDGQNASYLERRLRELSSPQAEAIDSMNPMYPIAKKLTDTDRADLAAYFASLPPVGK